MENPPTRYDKQAATRRRNLERRMAKVYEYVAARHVPLEKCVADAAAHFGIAESTVYRYLNEAPKPSKTDE